MGREPSYGKQWGYRAGAETHGELACRPMSTDHSVTMELWNLCGCSLVSLCLRPNLTHDSNDCESSTKVLVRTTQSKFQISLQPDQPQILVHR